MININLLPPEIKTKIKQKKQAANVFSICLVIVIIFAVFSILFRSFQETIFKSRLDTLQSEIQKSNSDLANFGDLEKEAAFLYNRDQLSTQIQKDNPNWAIILTDLVGSVPSGVQVTSLDADLSKSPNFVLQAVTTNEREAIKFKEKLENSNYFQNVAFKSATIASQNKTDPNSPEQLSFNLEFNLENNQ